ncbi:MAG: hypothetical protein JWM80_23 [Cyanobacteria bacterium RYN_339]|nr:hypothetical protein [Cyanobacteria bacterium RYN_339]
MTKLQQPILRGLMALCMVWLTACSNLPWGGQAVAPPVPVTGAKAPSMSVTAPTGWTGKIPDALLGTKTRDWSYDRLSGAALTKARKEAEAALGPKQARKLQAVGTTMPWGGSGLALSSFAGVTGHPTNGPAFAYVCLTAGLSNRVWFLTSTGCLLGVDKTTPTSNSGLTAYKVVNLGHACTKGFVTITEDALRIYTVSDDGYLIQVKTDTLAVTALPISAGASAAVGMSAFIDSVNSSNKNLETIFAGTNAGVFSSFYYNGTTLSKTATRTGVTVANAIDGSTTSLVSAGPVVINKVCYYGDRAGYAHILDFNAAAGSDLTTTYLNVGSPIETPPAIDLTGAGVPTDMFLATGFQVSWCQLTGNTVTSVTNSQPLYVDCNAGSAPPSNEGAVSAYAYPSKLSVANVTATDGCTAQYALSPPQAFKLYNSVPALTSYRTTDIGGSEVIDGASPSVNVIYGSNSNSDLTTYNNFSVVPPSAHGFDNPMGLTFGPEGDTYIGGKGASTSDGINIKCIPSLTYVPGAMLWGYPGATGFAAMTAKYSYLLAGPDANPTPKNPPGYVAGTNPNPKLGETDGVWYDQMGTLGSTLALRNDDYLWFACRDNTINNFSGGEIGRVHFGTGNGQTAGKVDILCGKSSAGTAHTVGTNLSPLASQLGGPYDVVRASNGLIFFTENTHTHLMAYNPTAANITLGSGGGAVTVNAGMMMAVAAYPTTGYPSGSYTPTTGDYFCNLCLAPGVGTAGSIFVCARDTYVVYKYDFASNTIAWFAGVPNSSAAQAVSGGLKSAACFYQPGSCVVDANNVLYVGEEGTSGTGGCRIKEIPTTGPDAGYCYILAGNGTAPSSIAAGGAVGPAAALGRVYGLMMGPADLATFSGTFDHVYATLRDLGSVVRLDFPPATADGARGLLNWNLGATYQNVCMISATVSGTTANATTCPRPDLVPISEYFSVNGAGSSGVLWASGVTLSCNNVPIVTKPYQLAVNTVPGTTATSPTTFAAGQALAYSLPVQNVPATGRLTLGMVPNASSGYTTHYPWAFNYNPAGNNVDDVQINGVAAATPPKLTATFSKFQMTSPILSPPAIFVDAGNTVKYVFVENTNAIFRLNYSSTATFSAAASSLYSLSGSSRGVVNGPIDATTAPASFIANANHPLFTSSGLVYTIDSRHTGGTNYTFCVNQFNGMNASGSVYQTIKSLGGQTMAAGASNGAAYATYDSYGFDVGTLYFGLGNDTIYAVSM